MTEDKKKSRNHYTIYSPTDGRILYQSEGRNQSETITSPTGKVLYKREVRDD